MAYTAGNVMDDAAALLNDAGKSMFTYATQLPYLRIAYKDMDQQLTLSGLELNLISEAEITVLAGATALGLPSSFFVPISLQEKLPAETNDKYYPIDERKDISALNEVATNTLRYWDFRHNCINFIGATVDRKVRLVYWRTLPDIVDQATQSEIRGGQNFLAFRTAELCSRYILGASARERSDNLRMESQIAGEQLVALYVKNDQGNRVRRKPFRTVRYTNTIP